VLLRQHKLLGKAGKYPHGHPTQERKEADGMGEKQLVRVGVIPQDYFSEHVVDASISYGILIW